MISDEQLIVIKKWINTNNLVLTNESKYLVEVKKSLYDKWYYEIERIEDKFVVSAFKEDERHIPFDLGSFDVSMSVEGENDLKLFLTKAHDYLAKYSEIDDSTVSIELVNFQESKYKIHIQGNPISLHTFIVYAKFERFLKDYISLLRLIDYDEYFWEHPKLNSTSWMSEYEVSIVESKRLNVVKPNPHPFSQYFKGDDVIVTFKNRGGNALLVVPEPDNMSISDFSTISRFIKNADSDLSIKFFKAVFREWHQNFKNDTNYSYLSTHGLGVHWLHVRIDKKPKYYHTIDYRDN